LWRWRAPSTSANRAFRDREDIARDLVGVAGLTAFAAGLVILAPSKILGFDASRAFAGIAGELGKTVPAAVLVLIVSLVELAAGGAIARLARRTPFGSISDALLAAAVATVLKDLVELSILGQAGWFRAPVLGLIDVALIVTAWRARPIVSTPWRPSVAALSSFSIAALIAIVWAGPILLQLASPVVPFIDVLPNHVAPAEHLRTFGTFTPLTSTQSPIYGPSRTFLGYVAVLGAVTTLSTLPAALALAAFVLPSTLLIAIAAYRLAVVVAGPAAGSWGVLAFALTGSFARLADDRATVVVFPLVAWGLAIVIERSRAPDASRATAERSDTWRLPDGVVVGLALGAAVFVHPVIGALAVATLGIAGLMRPERLGGLAVTATVTAGIAAAPQAATMIGIALPSIVLGLALAAAIPVGVAVSRGESRYPQMLGPLRIALVIAAAAIVVVIRPPVGPLVEAPGPFLEGTALLLIAGVVGVLAGIPAARSLVPWVGIAVGFGFALATQLVPTNAGLLAQALRFEVPKTLHYWIPVIAFVPAAATLAWLWHSDRINRLAGIALLGVWIVVAALPVRLQPIDALHLGEHRFAESMALDLRWAASGYWTGYPDSREIVDAPRRGILDAVRAEIAAGRIGPDTPVLHVVRSFQQWDATPLGVFDGVTETDVSPDAEDSIHTVGGRLLHMESLPALLESKAYPYLLLERAGLDPGTAAAVAAAGYTATFTNRQGTLYRLAGT
jgi:hypothetical protein